MRTTSFGTAEPRRSNPARLAALIPAVGVLLFATSCVGPQLEPPRFASGSDDGPAPGVEQPTDDHVLPGVTCDLPGPGGYFETAGAEDVALDRSALERAVAYATARGAQSLRVYRHGCLVARGGNDWLTERQRLPGWSMTKGVVSAVVGRAVQLGLVSVDDPIGAHLSGLEPEVAALSIHVYVVNRKN